MPTAWDLMNAIDRADIDTVKACLADPDLDLNYISEIAASYGQSPLMRAIGQAGSNADNTELRQQIALQIITSSRVNIAFSSPSGYNAIHEAARAQKPELMRALLIAAQTRGLNMTELINKPFKHTHTEFAPWITFPLYEASSTGNQEVVQLLITAGADIHALNGRRHDETAWDAAWTRVTGERHEAKRNAEHALAMHINQLTNTNRWPQEALSEAEIKNSIATKKIEITNNLQLRLAESTAVIQIFLNAGIDPLPPKIFLEHETDDSGIMPSDDPLHRILVDAATSRVAYEAGAGAKLKVQLKLMKSSDLSIEAGCKNVLLQIHRTLTEDAILSSLRSTKLKDSDSLQDIIQHAMTSKNRSRDACVELKWLTKEGTLGAEAPRPVIEAYRRAEENLRPAAGGPHK